MDEFREEAKKQLENTLISIKAKNKVVTQNVNITKKTDGVNRKVQQTPRGQLHNETIYGSQQKYVLKEEVVNAKFDAEKIASVTKPALSRGIVMPFTGFWERSEESIYRNKRFVEEAHLVRRTSHSAST